MERKAPARAGSPIPANRPEYRDEPGVGAILRARDRGLLPVGDDRTHSLSRTPEAPR